MRSGRVIAPITVALPGSVREGLRSPRIALRPDEDPAQIKRLDDEEESGSGQGVHGQFPSTKQNSQSWHRRLNVFAVRTSLRGTPASSSFDQPRNVFAPGSHLENSLIRSPAAAMAATIATAVTVAAAVATVVPAIAAGAAATEAANARGAVVTRTAIGAAAGGASLLAQLPDGPARLPDGPAGSYETQEGYDDGFQRWCLFGACRPRCLPRRVSQR